MARRQQTCTCQFVEQVHSGNKVIPKFRSPTYDVYVKYYRILFFFFGQQPSLFTIQFHKITPIRYTSDRLERQILFALTNEKKGKRKLNRIHRMPTEPTTLSPLPTSTLLALAIRITDTKNVRNMPFPWKVHLMLEKAEKDEKTASMISWLPDGLSFKVHDKEEFARELMPEMFATSSFKAFQRSLNFWGYDTVSKGPDKGIYSHPSFVRDDPELCNTMKRVHGKKTSNSFQQKQQQQNEHQRRRKLAAYSMNKLLERNALKKTLLSSPTRSCGSVGGMPMPTLSLPKVMIPPPGRMEGLSGNWAALRNNRAAAQVRLHREALREVAQLREAVVDHAARRLLQNLEGFGII